MERLADPFDNFSETCKGHLSSLKAKFGMRLWGLSFTDGLEFTFFETIDEIYGIKNGDTYNWIDTYCSRMVRKEGPYIAPNSTEVKAYDQAEINGKFPIRSYVGFPLLNSAGKICGTICGYDPEPQPNHIIENLPILNSAARDISLFIQKKLTEVTDYRLESRRNELSSVDPQSGLPGLDTWFSVLKYEERFASMLQDPTYICVLKVNSEFNADTNNWRELNELLRNFFPEEIPIVKLNEFKIGLIIPNCSHTKFNALRLALRIAFREQKWSVQFGHSRRNPSRGLFETYHDASASADCQIALELAS